MREPPEFRVSLVRDCAGCQVGRPDTWHAVDGRAIILCMACVHDLDKAWRPIDWCAVPGCQRAATVLARQHGTGSPDRLVCVDCAGLRQGSINLPWSRFADRIWPPTN